MFDRTKQFLTKTIGGAAVIETGAIRTKAAPRSWSTAPFAGRNTTKFILSADQILGSSKDLTSRTLRRMYKQTSTVRACVDSVTRQIATQPWQLKPAGSVGARRVERFLKRLNVNKETFQQLLFKLLPDLLVLDRCVTEKVYSTSEPPKLMELWGRDSSTFIQKVDGHGVITGYEQKVALKKPVPFEAQEIGYLVLHPKTNSTKGTPILESVVQEVATYLFMQSFIGDSFTEDEIPPGALVIGAIGDKAYDRAQAQFEAEKGSAMQRRIKVIDNAESVSWVEFRRPHRELAIPELFGLLNRAVYRAFGLPPSTMGESEGVPRSAAVVQERGVQSRLVRPICNIVANFINVEVVQELLGPNTRVEFSFIESRVEEMARQARAYKDLVFSGQATINEVRSMQGQPEIQVDWANRHFIVLGKSILFMDTLESVSTEGTVDALGAMITGDELEVVDSR